METQKNSENNIVLEMKRLLGRMMVQVDYMYRNDREMSRLDLDIMMERTRDFYDLLCDYGVRANHHLPADEVLEDEPIKTEINEGGELINPDVDFEIETPDEVLKEPEPEPETPVETNDDSPADETPGAIHVLPVDENDDVVDDEDEEDWEDEDDQPFRIEQPEDNSLAARLQRTPITDIKSAMGINDKVMIINDLFMGSVDRYNKSINALNEFPTLSGAKVYMSELQIELQWDTDSQAYRILNDLVERRFI